MPIYAYRCTACGHAKDVLQKLSDAPLRVCPACGAETFTKQVTAAGFQLKGSGWYVTDFRGGNQAGAKGKDAKESSSGDGAEGQGADKPASKGAEPGRPGRVPERGHPGPAGRKYLFAGLLVWLPLAITIWVLSWLLGAVGSLFDWLLDLSRAVLPLSAHGAIDFIAGIPGLGAIVLAAALLLTGMFAANVAGAWWVRQWHALMRRIPIVSSIYGSVMQVSDTLFSSGRQAFREAVLVQ